MFHISNIEWWRCDYSQFIYRSTFQVQILHICNFIIYLFISHIDLKQHLTLALFRKHLPSFSHSLLDYKNYSLAFLIVLLDTIEQVFVLSAMRLVLIHINMFMFGLLFGSFIRNVMLVKEQVWENILPFSLHQLGWVILPYASMILLG